MDNESNKVDRILFLDWWKSLSESEKVKISNKYSLPYPSLGQIKYAHLKEQRNKI
jgi:hypothetical protein